MPILSILIPTKNNVDVLRECLHSLEYFFGMEDVEILVHDNSDQIKDLEIIKNNMSWVKNLHIVHSDEKYSQSENYEAVSLLANGEYQTIIGDDDSVFPEIMNLVLFMSRNQIQASYSGFSTFIWPSVVFDGAAGQFEFGKLSANYETNARCAEELDRVFKSGCVSMGQLPRVYYGLVHTDIMKKIRSFAGTAFPGPSPDIANAVAVASMVDTYLLADYPVFIAGNCKSSNAAKGLRKEHVGNLEDQSFLPKNIIDTWPDQIPKYWSGPTIWAASSLKTASIVNSEKYREFNREAFLAHELVFNSRLILSHMDKHRSISTNYKIWFYTVKIFAIRLIFYIKRKYKVSAALRIDTLIDVSRLKLFYDDGTFSS